MIRFLINLLMEHSDAFMIKINSFNLHIYFLRFLDGLAGFFTCTLDCFTGLDCFDDLALVVVDLLVGLEGALGALLDFDCDLEGETRAFLDSCEAGASSLIVMTLFWVSNSPNTPSSSSLSLASS